MEEGEFFYILYRYFVFIFSIFQDWLYEFEQKRLYDHNYFFKKAGGLK